MWVRRSRMIVSLAASTCAAVTGADVVATDTWVSMGQEEELSTRKGSGSPFTKYAVTTELMAHQKWSTWRMPALNARSISAQVALECPQVMKQRRRRAAL